MKESTDRSMDWLKRTYKYRFHIFAVSAVLALLILARFLPHPPNMTPIGALALFCGAILPSRMLAFSLPIAVLLLSDWFLGFHSTVLFVYGGFLLVTLIGRVFLAKNRRALSIFASATVGSLAFFFVSNFGVWWVGFYPPTWDGLLACYVAALPFFHYTWLGDILYSATAFFVWERLYGRFCVYKNESVRNYG